MTRTRVPLWLAVAVLAALPSSLRADTELLPEVSLHLEAARYAPTETDLHWTSWIGAGAGLVRFGKSTVTFTADLETTLGNTRRAFDATQANYHLEGGVRRTVGRGTVGVFLHHVSRHLEDRPKEQAVDWNVLLVRASWPIGSRPIRLTASLGHTTQDSLIGYRWEVTQEIRADVLTRPWGALYLVERLRGVTTESTERFPRDGFVDVWAEGGVRFGKERRLALFAAFEHRNDVLLEEPGARDRGLFGFRISKAP